MPRTHSYIQYLHDNSRYETGNNIQAEEQGYLKTVGDNQDQSALVQSGSYSYTAPDGQVITVEYTADEFGFRVKGDHIPTPPPVSPEIQKGLDLIYAGIKANQVNFAYVFCQCQFSSRILNFKLSLSRNCATGTEL